MPINEGPTSIDLAGPSWFPRLIGGELVDTEGSGPFMPDMITIEPLRDGSYRATFLDVDALETPSLDYLVMALRNLGRMLEATDAPRVPILVKDHAEDTVIEEDDDDDGFEADLDYLMAKNAELYRRLGR